MECVCIDAIDCRTTNAFVKKPRDCVTSCSASANNFNVCFSRPQFVKIDAMSRCILNCLFCKIKYHIIYLLSLYYSLKYERVFIVVCNERYNSQVKKSQ